MLAYMSSLLSEAWKTAPPFSTTVHSAIWESFFVVWEWFSSFEFLWTRRTTLVETRPSTPSFSITYLTKKTFVKYQLRSSSNVEVQKKIMITFPTFESTRNFNVSVSSISLARMSILAIADMCIEAHRDTLGALLSMKLRLTANTDNKMMDKSFIVLIITAVKDGGNLRQEDGNVELCGITTAVEVSVWFVGRCWILSRLQYRFTRIPIPFRIIWQQHNDLEFEKLAINFCNFVLFNFNRDKLKLLEIYAGLKNFLRRSSSGGSSFIFNLRVGHHPPAHQQIISFSWMLSFECS